MSLDAVAMASPVVLTEEARDDNVLSGLKLTAMIVSVVFLILSTATNVEYIACFHSSYSCYECLSNINANWDTILVFNTV